MDALQALARRTTELDGELKQNARALEAPATSRGKSQVIEALTQRLERLERLTSASPTAAELQALTVVGAGGGLGIDLAERGDERHQPLPFEGVPRTAPC